MIPMILIMNIIIFFQVLSTTLPQLKIKLSSYTNHQLVMATAPSLPIKEGYLDLKCGHLWRKCHFTITGNRKLFCREDGNVSLFDSFHIASHLFPRPNSIVLLKLIDYDLTF